LKPGDLGGALRPLDVDEGIPQQQGLKPCRGEVVDPVEAVVSRSAHRLATGRSILLRLFPVCSILSSSSGRWHDPELGPRPAATYVGDHRALDFLNGKSTPSGAWTEWLRDGADLVNELHQVKS
jgi:hypothetical protein